MSEGPKEAQNDPKLGKKLKSGIKTFLRKQKLLVYMHKLQNGIDPYLNPKNSPIRPKKAQNDPKISKDQETRKVKKFQSESS